MVKRVYDSDNVGYVEYSDDGKVQRVKKFYGNPRFYKELAENINTKEKEYAQFENAVYSWNDNVGVA